MKKRFIVLSSLITILLASFPLVICADEVAQDSSNLHTLSDGVLLDQYFYDNYDLMPYIESTGYEYIDTGILAKNDLIIDLTASDLVFKPQSYGALFGSQIDNSIYGIRIYKDNIDRSLLNFYLSQYNYPLTTYPYSLMDIKFDNEKVYINNNLIHEFPDTEFESRTIYIFAMHISTGAGSLGTYKLYKFSIFDKSANDGEGEYVRYYYPAKAKTSGTIGLYDAISKTFFVSGGTRQFTNPTDDKVLNFQISDFLTSGLGWIDDIFDFVVSTPIILFFFAVALAGSIYRWARRVVHF